MKDQMPSQRPSKKHATHLRNPYEDINEIIQKRIADMSMEPITDINAHNILIPPIHSVLDGLSEEFLKDLPVPSNNKLRAIDPARRAHNRQQSKLFDDLADRFDHPVPTDTQDRLRKIVTSGVIRAGESVLDVATGTGVLLPFILERHPSRVVACDLSSKMIARAKVNFKGNVRFFRKDVMDMAGSMPMVDVVFCNACFSNFHNPIEVLLSINSLCFYGARIIISHPMGREFITHLKIDHPGMVTTDLPNYAEIKSMLNLAGFRLELFQDLPKLFIAVGKKIASFELTDTTINYGSDISAG
jgi:SAM-dependent methyltransferase